MAGGLNSSDNQSPLAEINVTPLVDVMLVLLVIFMVTAPLMETGIPIQLPKASGKALPKEESPVTLNLSREGKIFLGQEEVSISNLTVRLKTFYKNRNQKEIFIRADGALPYALVAQTMALVKEAEIHKIGLVTLPPEKVTNK